MRASCAIPHSTHASTCVRIRIYTCGGGGGGAPSERIQISETEESRALAAVLPERQSPLKFTRAGKTLEMLRASIVHTRSARVIRYYGARRGGGREEEEKPRVVVNRRAPTTTSGRCCWRYTRQEVAGRARALLQNRTRARAAPGQFSVL